MLFRSGGACPGLLASISPSQQKDFISDKYHGVSAVDRLAAVDPVGSIGCGPSSVGARLCQSPAGRSSLYGEAALDLQRQHCASPPLPPPPHLHPAKEAPLTGRSSALRKLPPTCFAPKWLPFFQAGGGRGSPSLDHLLESLGKGTSSCHLCGIREQWLPFTGSHAGNEDEGKQGQNANGALQN